MLSAAAIHTREQQALADLPDELRGLPLDQVELKATNMVGVDALEIDSEPHTLLPAPAVLERVASEHQGVLEEPHPLVRFDDFTQKILVEHTG